MLKAGCKQLNPLIASFVRPISIYRLPPVGIIWANYGRYNYHGCLGNQFDQLCNNKQVGYAAWELKDE